jgi:hypothetical protein
MPEKVHKAVEVCHRLNPPLEKDFTTQGVRGNLQCPFAKALPTPPSGSKDIDPIKTDLLPDHLSPPPSVTGSAGKCPIRFLDQQSPEKVAQYFQEHKHEIPRSHEICVKRYQTNSESIRQLDAKYGNLVSMIQGLGAKHQPYLKETEMDRTSTERVEQWAEAVGEPDDAVEDDDRTGHFERSLRDVRLGESPSRPWGIQVPVEETAKAVSEPELTESPQKPREIPAQCPFSKSRTRAETAAESHKASQTSSRTGIVFKGPVFFGYSADDAIRMMQAGISFGDSIK